MNHAAAAPSTRKLMKIADAAIAKGRGQEAWDTLQQIIAINPGNTDALYKAGFILHSVGKYDEAEHYYRRATIADPKNFAAYQQILRIMESQVRGKEALELAQQLARNMPEEKHAHVEFMRQMMRFNHVHMVPPYAELALTQFPDDGDITMQYAIALKVNGRYEEADVQYRKLAKSYKLPLQLRLTYELYLPRGYRSSEEIETMRKDFSDAIDGLVKDKPNYPISTFHYQPVFQLAFHNHDNKDMLRKYHAMLRAIAPELNYTAPHCKPNAKPRREGPIRIGFLSRHMYNHSVGNCYRDTLIALGQQPEFEVVLFDPANAMDVRMAEIRASNVKVVPLPKMLEPAQEAVTKFEPDIMVYPDIGMDSTTSYMAMARLAPHQLVLQGHPETTGIDTLDYYLSQRAYEAPTAQQNYTERLLCTEGIGLTFKRPTPPEKWQTRAELNLPEDKRLYVCPMAIQKFHPDFDGVLAGILAADPEAVIVLFNDFQQQTASDHLRERITAKCDPARVVFLPWLPLDSLFSVMKETDALLDTVYFGGGTTVQYAFGFGFPMVTMPTTYIRGRVVHSHYMKMGIDNPPVADSLEGYVKTAVKLATDKAYYNDLKAQILAKNDPIFSEDNFTETFIQLMRDMAANKLEAYAR